MNCQLLSEKNCKDKWAIRCCHISEFPVRKLPATAFTGPNHTSFRLIYGSLQITSYSLFSNYVKQWLGRALCRRDILLTEQVNTLFIISPVTIFDCNRKLNALTCFPLCADLKPKNMRAGRGLRDCLFESFTLWTLSSRKKKISFRKENGDTPRTSNTGRASLRVITAIYIF